MATLQTALSLTSGDFEREFAKAAGVVGKYTAAIEQQGNRNLQRARGEVEALRLEATGHQAAADALRQKITIEEQAATLARQTGITQENAMRITTRRIELEKQLAAQQARTSRVGGGGRVGLPDLPLTTAEMNRTFIATEKTNKSLRALQGSGTRGSLGFLAVSQAVEDAQYGLKGVLNNIPQAVLGFGGGAGLAGALSLAAVAGYSLYRAVKSFSGLEEAEDFARRSAAAMDAFTESQRKNIEATKDRSRAIELSNKLNDISSRQGIKTELKLGVDEDLESDFQRQQRAQERFRQARDALADASAPGADPLAAVRAKYVNEEADAANDLADAQKRLTDSGAEWSRVWKNLRDTGGELFTKANAAATKAEEIQRLLDGRKQELAALQAGNKDAKGQEKSKNDLSIRTKQQAIADLAGQLKDLRAEEDKYNQLLADARSTGQSSLTTYQQRIAAAKEDIAVSKERIKLTNQLAQAEAARLKAETAAARQRYNDDIEILRGTLEGNQAVVDQIERKRRFEEEVLRIKKEQLGITQKDAAALANRKLDAEDAIRDQGRDKEKAEDAGRKRASQLQLGQELQVLRLRASGRSKEAAALEKEFDIRAEAVRLAKDTGRSEEDALKVLRSRQRLLDQIERNENTPERRRSAIYKKDSPAGGINAAGGRRIGFSGRIGLGGTATENARNARPRDPEASARTAAAAYYQKNLQQNEELLNIWRNIGVA